MNSSYPNFEQEKALLQQGFNFIVGVDEAGVGSLAGPLVAAAVVLPLSSRIGELDDSKTKSKKAREALYELILDRSAAYAVGETSVEEINLLGIRPANYLAMRRAIEQIPGADFALVDAWTIPELLIPQHGIIKGDHLVKSIAAASIIAKVTRDRIMQKIAEKYPEYGFEIHKGYGTALHRQRIEEFGPCAMHRVSWGCFTKSIDQIEKKC